MLNLIFYFLLCVTCVARDDWRGYAFAGGVRLALFDPVCNWSKGDSPFSVGTSALTDRALQWLAGRWTSARTLSALVRGFAFWSCCLFWFFWLFLATGCAATRHVATSPDPVLSVHDPHENDSVRTKRPQGLAPFSTLSRSGKKASSKSVGQKQPAQPKKGILSFLKKDQSRTKTAARTKIKNSTVIIQAGDNNSAENKPIEKQKATGSSSAASDQGTASTATTKAGGVPWWFILLGVAGGILLGAKFSAYLKWIPFLGLLFLLNTPAKAQGPIQLHRGGYHYSYKEARTTQHYINRKRRQFQRAEKREFAALRRDHQRQQLYFNRYHRKKR